MNQNPNRVHDSHKFFESKDSANLSGKLRRDSEFKYGFSAPFKTKFLRIIARLFVSVFRLNSNSSVSTEICQLIEPKSVVQFNDQTIFFRSGHGRLKWRADTFHTEEPLMVEWLESFRPHDVFLDIGANVGTYTIPAAFLCDLVIAVELDPSNVSCLYSNIHYNKLYSKVIIVPFAVGKGRCVAEIHYRDFSVGDALQSVGRPQVLPTQKPLPHSLLQLCIPIDNLFEEFELPQPTKIKIDVDGNELQVLEGAWGTASRAEEIYFEDNALDGDNYILDRLSKFGFEIVREAPGNLGSAKSDLSRNLLFRRKI